MLRVPYASRGGGGVRRPLDGSGLLLRLLGLDRARRGARPLLSRTRARCGTAASCRRTRSSCWPTSAAATSKSTAPSTLDWDALRERIKQHGMRNSNCVAIAPTATISNIIGVSASHRADFQNLFVKSNLSGEFTVINEYLVRDLKALGLWDEVMVADLKYFDGSLAADRPRAAGRCASLYATAFEVEPKWLVEAGARRQKWIDQAQSLNIYMAGASGKKLDETYKLAWLRGLKTTYYLRTMGATHAEKSTTKTGALNAVPTAERTPRRRSARSTTRIARPASDSSSRVTRRRSSPARTRGCGRRRARALRGRWSGLAACHDLRASATPRLSTGAARSTSRTQVADDRRQRRGTSTSPPTRCIRRRSEDAALSWRRRVKPASPDTEDSACSADAQALTHFAWHAARHAPTRRSAGRRPRADSAAQRAGAADAIRRVTRRRQAHHQRPRPTSTSWCRSSTSGPGTSTSPPAPTTGCRRKST